MAKVRKAVIAAAGRATRQYPASTAIQKVMFPLVDRDGLTKPTIQIIAEEALDAGIEEICIVTQPGEESHYRDYFKRLDNDMVRAFRHCKGTTCSSDDRDFRFGLKMISGNLWLSSLELIERPPCPGH